jgi:FkbH-like protein
MMNLSQYSVDQLLLKRRSLRRTLLASSGLRPLRVAILGGSTTNELVDLWELLLLSEGFQPEFHQTEYGRYHIDAVRSPEELIAFRPDLVYVHTSVRNIDEFPPLQSTEQILAECITRETSRFREIWSSITEHIGCQIIQNNFEQPINHLLGNFDAAHSGGRTRFVNELNARFASEAAGDPKLILQDLHGISANVGLMRWFDQARWHSYKISNSIEGTFEIAQSLTAIVRSIYGRSRKCLVLDLDNTLWGGVIGDDGVDEIVIGRETPVAEAYLAFQEYCLRLRERGVLLAVCSKNTEDIARQGFEHPDSALRAEHFSAFRINWNPKHENVRELALELNLGLESFVFVDDNPVERALVEANLPEVAVPDVGEDVAVYAEIIEARRYFEPISLSQEDLSRARLYQENTQRISLESKFSSYGEFLDSLEMSAEIERFRSVYIERIAQLTNKTNQFNLTTRRYTLAEMRALAEDHTHIGLYGKLSDRFGEHGLVSVVLGRRAGSELHLDLWLMSCRVLKRDMEIAMLDRIATLAADERITKLIGYYIPTKKNAMVAGHYERLGFEPISKDPVTGESIWVLDLSKYSPQNGHVKVVEAPHG